MTPYYEDGLVTIYHGDALEVMGSVAADVLVTDPPYGIGVNQMNLGSRPKWRRLDRGDRDWDAGTPDVAALVGGRPAIVWGGNYFVLPPQRGWLVWDKQNGATDYADCELAWTNLDQPVRRIVCRWMGANAKEVGERRYHPTQKPETVMRWCIAFTPPGTILDPFAGSGTTLVAAKELGRHAIGIEIEERYCEIAARRCSQEVLGLSVEPDLGGTQT